MAEQKNRPAAPEAPVEVTQTAVDSPGGVSLQQVEPTVDRSDKDLKADLTRPDEADLALQEPSHPADRTPYPVAEQPPHERPPFSTARPDVPIVSSAVKGAGAHTPPPPDQFLPDGRPRGLSGHED